MEALVRPQLAAAIAVLGLSGPALADVFTLNPAADAFVGSAQPGNNYGGGGALAISAAGLAQGQYQSVMRFDTSAAVASLNAAYGAGQWTIQSITLQLTAASPNNPIFNTQAAGQFAVGWMGNDGWVEGSGTPAAPTTTGITFTTLPGFLSGTDEALGTFTFGGATSGSSVYTLALSSGFVADVSAGGLVSLRLSAADAAVSYVFNSRSIGATSSRPVLAITAVPAPGGATALFAAAAIGMRRSRRNRA